MLRAAEAERTLVAGFVNYSAVCEQLRHETRPIHIICAGTDGEVSLEDTLLAGALVDYLSEETDVDLNDMPVWRGTVREPRADLACALEIGLGGVNLRRLGYDADIKAAADVDKFHLVPELRRDPLRVEIGSVGIVKSRWKRSKPLDGLPSLPQRVADATNTVTSTPDFPSFHFAPLRRRIMFATRALVGCRRACPHFHQP